MDLTKLAGVHTTGKTYEGASDYAVVASGSNANGTYVRYADGTQICSINVTFNNYGGWGTGNRLIITSTNWAYPAAYVSAPYGGAFLSSQSISAAGTVRREDLNFQYYQSLNTQLQTAAVYCVTNSGSSWTSGDSMTGTLFAFGRWY